MIDYLLVVVTHGAGESLWECLQSFKNNVSPAPAYLYVHRDEPDGDLRVPQVCEDGRVEIANPAVGFCEATRRAWQWAAESPHDYVFWLEHDFIFERPVDLSALAGELDWRSNTLAQMSLMRGPVNEREIAAGGLYESRRDDYTLQFTSSESEAWPFLEHRAYFTTNPSLMRRGFLEGNPWPHYEQFCEGKFGVDLVETGWSFGVWGAGEPWVRHTGERTGFGY